MAFGDDLLKFAEKVERRGKAVFAGSVVAVHDSVTEGSEITGAPGQPVDTGALLASWQITFPEEWVGQTTTAQVYAPGIEDGIGPYGAITLRSDVGGFHSVKLTRSSWDRIVESEARKVRGV